MFAHEPRQVPSKVGIDTEMTARTIYWNGPKVSLKDGAQITSMDKYTADRRSLMTNVIETGAVKGKLDELPFYVEGQPPDFRKLEAIDYLDELKTIWGREWGGQGLGRLRMALVSKPTEDEITPYLADPAYFIFGRRGVPDLKRAIREHDQMVEVLKGEGVELAEMKRPTEEQSPWPGKKGPYGVPIRMLVSAAEAFVVHGGAIIQRRLFPFKKGIEVVATRTLSELGCPILCTVVGKGAWCTGAVSWLDYEHLVAGLLDAPDMNREAVEQVRPILEKVGVKEIILVRGGSYAEYSIYGHLDAVFNTIDLGVALATTRPLAKEDLDHIRKKGIDIIETAPGEEYCCNVNLIEPGKIMMPIDVDHPPKQTMRCLREQGIDVIEVDWTHRLKIGGGLHCAVGHLVRDMPGPLLSELDRTREGKIIKA